jgi:argonaute-like protein implicated in RNA metabolism and viral defense
VILPWQLDYRKAIGDVLEKLEWGLLSPIVWPIKKYIRKRRAEKARKAQQLVDEENTQELDQLPKDPDVKNDSK